MKNSNSTARYPLVLLFLSVLCLSMPFQTVSANTDYQLTEQELAAIDTLNKELNQIYIQEKNVTNKIVSIIQDLLLNIKSNTIRVQHKDAFQENALLLQELIYTLQKNLSINADPVIIDQLQFFNHAIMEHLLKTLKQPRPRLTEFDTVQCWKSYRSANISFEGLEGNLSKNNALLKQLTKESSEAGLSRLNKSYRILNNYIIQPCAKRNIHGIAGAGIGSALFLLTAYMHVYGQTEGYPAWIAKFFGKMPETDYRGCVTNRHELNHLGQATTFLIEFQKGVMPITAALYHYLQPKWATNIIKPVTKRISKETTKFHNKCMGGAYARKQEERDGWMINPRCDFNSIIGNADAVNQIRDIVDYLENPEGLDGKKIAPEKGWLLTGETRTGKSYLVEALAGEIKKMYIRTGKNPANFKFFKVQPEWIKNEGGMKDLITEAKSYAPCILFLDEIDLLNLQRTGNTGLLHSFLDGMNGALESDPDKVVIMIAATNSPETLEKALKQHGRFGKRIEFVYPSYKNRKEFLYQRIKGIAHFSSIDFDRLSLITEGASYETLNTIISRAAFAAVIRNEPLTQALIEESLSKDVQNIATVDDLELPEDERELIALHQSARALSMILLDPKDIFDKVITKPYLAELKEVLVWDQYDKTKQKTSQQKRKYGRIFSYHRKDSRGISTHPERIKQCKIALAGNVAETLVYGQCGNTYEKELADNAYEIALSLVSNGMNVNLLSPRIKTTYEEKAIELVETCKQEVMELLTQNKHLLDLVYQELLQKQELSRTEIIELTGLKDPVFTQELAQQRVANAVQEDLDIEELTDAETAAA